MDGAPDVLVQEFSADYPDIIEVFRSACFSGADAYGFLLKLTLLTPSSLHCNLLTHLVAHFKYLVLKLGPAGFRHWLVYFAYFEAAHTEGMPEI